MLRDKFRLSKEKAELIYSIMTTIAIPLIVVLGAIFIAVNVQHDFETEQKHKTELTSNVITQAIKDNLNKRSLLQQQIDTYHSSNTDISQLTVLKQPQAGSKEFTIIASADQSEIAKEVKDVDYDLVISSRQPVSRPIKNDDGRSWQVLSPIIDNDKVIAIVGLNISLVRADSLMRMTLVKSLLVGSAVVLVIILLLINDVLFLEHALLPRRARQEDNPPPIPKVDSQSSVDDTDKTVNADT